MTSKEEFQRKLKALVVQRAREIIANQDENRAKAAAARDLFAAVRDAETWRIVDTPKPKNFTPPEAPELWTQPVNVIDKRKRSDEPSTD